jgi:SAM-dependent methyltransferase
MIDINNIIKVLDKYNNKNFTFYEYCKNKLKELNKNITTIHKKNYILVGIREYILSEPDEFTLFLSGNKYKSISHVSYDLDKNELINLLELIELNEKYNSNILEITKIKISNNLDSIIKNLNIKMKNNKYQLYFNIAVNNPDKKININDINYYKIKNYYDSVSLLLNIENIRLLKYQKLDRIKNFIETNEEAIGVYKILQDYNEDLHKLGFQERDLMIIHSGSIFEVLGTTYTRDVDVIKVDMNSTQEELKKYIEGQCKLVDMSILDKNLNYITKCHSGNMTQLRYKKQWFTKTLPNLIGAKDIFEVYTNPKHHFYFAGIKFSSLEFNIQRFLQRASISSMADLIMLQEINGYPTHSRLCLPNMTIRQGKFVVFYGKYLEVYYKELQKSLKRYYNKEILMEQLQKLIRFCTEGGHDIYKGEITWDPDTSIIKYYHVKIKEEILNKYTKNCKYLLDIGSGKLTDMRLWDKNDIKNVVGIEPSKESIKIGEEKITKFGFKGNLHIVHGFGDKDWKSNKVYSKVLENKYDIITIQFAFHYMTKNLDTIISNIKSVINKGGKLIITCMDGNKIHNDFIKFKGNIEIRNDQEPIFAISPRYKIIDTIPDNNNDILVYFKGAFGVSSGSIEPILDIDKIIKIFESKGLKLIEKRNFTEYENDTKRKMSHIQLRVSSYYMMMVFENK